MRRVAATLLVLDSPRDSGNCLKQIGVKTTMYETVAIWSIWSQLSFLYRPYWLLLSLISLYTLFSAASLVRRLRISYQRNDSSGSSRMRAEALITNLRQVIAAMFFAFGALFFWALPSAFSTIGLSRNPPLNEIIGAFATHFAFAANVFFVLWLLHCVQWFVSRRILVCEVGTDK
jgi:hypothetical protein